MAAPKKKELDFEIVSAAVMFPDGFKSQIAKKKEQLENDGRKFVKEEITAFGSLVWIGWYEK